jgi:hypothetical protein
VSRDPGRASETDRLDGLLEMYRTAIAHLESLNDPAVAPLKRELETLLRFAHLEHGHPRASGERPDGA